MLKETALERLEAVAVWIRLGAGGAIAADGSKAEACYRNILEARPPFPTVAAEREQAPKH